MGRRQLPRSPTLKSELQHEDPSGSSDEVEKGFVGSSVNGNSMATQCGPGRRSWFGRTSYAATFMAQLEVLSGREWKCLRRSKTLFFLHVAVILVLDVFCGRSFRSLAQHWS